MSTSTQKSISPTLYEFSKDVLLKIAADQNKVSQGYVVTRKKYKPVVNPTEKQKQTWRANGAKARAVVLANRAKVAELRKLEFQKAEKMLLDLKQRSLSQGDIARECSIPVGWVSKLATGNTTRAQWGGDIMSLDRIVAINEVLKTVLLRYSKKVPVVESDFFARMDTLLLCHDAIQVAAFKIGGMTKLLRCGDIASGVQSTTLYKIAQRLFWQKGKAGNKNFIVSHRRALFILDSLERYIGDEIVIYQE